MQSGNLLDALNSTSSLRSSIGSSSGLDHLNLHSEVRAVNSAGPLGSSGSFSGTDLNGSQLLSGPRLVQDLSDHLNSLSSSDERKKLISSLLQLIDDDCLVLLGNRLEAEKKGRRKGNKNKDSKDNNNSLKNKKGDKNNKDPDVNSNGNNSIGSSSMEAIPETSGSQLQSTSSLPQTSPTTGSRKTFAGDFNLLDSSLIRFFSLFISFFLRVLLTIDSLHYFLLCLTFLFMIIIILFVCHAD